jgi:hypothetical protein
MKILKFCILFLLATACKSKPIEQVEKLSNSDVIVVDSIPLNNGKSIFWYKLKDMLGSSSVSYIGIYANACQIDSSNYLVKGDLLYQINLLGKNTLQITSHSGIEIVHKTDDMEFVDKHFEHGQKFTRNTLTNEVILDSICK